MIKPKSISKSYNYCIQVDQLYFSISLVNNKLPFDTCNIDGPHNLCTYFEKIKGGRDTFNIM